MGLPGTIARLASAAGLCRRLNHGPTKPFSAIDEAGPKHESVLMALDQTTGCDHVGIHHRLDLRRVLQNISRRRRQVPAPVDLAPMRNARQVSELVVLALLISI
jgi:hypothetical protein